MISCMFFWTLVLFGRQGYSQAQDNFLSVDFSILSLDNTSQPVSAVKIDTTSTDRLNVLCNVSAIPDFKQFIILSINTINQNGVIQRLAYMSGLNQTGAKPLSDSDITPIGNFHATKPTLGISLKVSNLSCEDTTKYKCSLAYVNNDYKPEDISAIRSLTVSAPPSNLTMMAINESSSLPITDVGFTSANPAAFMVGQSVNLTCIARLGTHKDSTIKWNKNSVAIGNESEYIESEADLVKACDYEKTGSLFYNITEEDAMLTSNNRLELQCFVFVADVSFETPADARQTFYIDVYNPKATTTTTIATTTTKTTTRQYIITTTASMGNATRNGDVSSSSNDQNRITSMQSLAVSFGVMFIRYQQNQM
ncbi:uncharacterized protein LOC127835019 [Dreissena polymorpha]|uniref:Ig-like domain-containing protein n=1 Tax=Dreissena polymorpha TaxID=45954 RepID=A0A9D4JKR8_DREPO|nr:uncharacterized protein LOC127835019 [Dreissena polymorpha]KAH3815690.1 hypothetical protein DPMN_144221 [Dreissena polymorpha]